MAGRAFRAREAVRIGAAGLGAGTLLVPAALSAPAGPGGAAPGRASAGWPVWLSLLVAAALVGWGVLLAGAGGTRERGAAGLAREGLGPRAARAVHGLYVAGIAVGQAALAAAAGDFAADGAASLAVSAAVLVTAAAVAAVVEAKGLRIPPTLLRLRLAAVPVLAVLWRCFPGLLDLDGRLRGGGGGGGLGDARPWAVAGVLTALPLLFAWVGLEGAVPAGGRRSGRGPGALLALAAGVGAPAVLYAVLLAPRTPAPGAGTGGTSPVGVVAAVVLGAYCVTNLRSAGAHGAETVRRRGTATPRNGVLLAAAAALAVLAATTAARLPVAVVLLGPGAATAAIYAILAVSAARLTKISAGASLPVRSRTTTYDKESPMHSRFPSATGPASDTVSKVRRVPAAKPEEAAAHFLRRRTFEADVSDVHADIEAGVADFVLVDTRGEDAWEQGHIPGAVHLPTDDIADRAAALVGRDKLVVTYCWGPGCNGAVRAAHAFAGAGYRVKEMLGGFEYWSREGFPVEDAEGVRRTAPDPLTAPAGSHCGC